MDKERVLELKKRREETNKNMIAAQNSAVETAKRAEKVKEQAAEVREVLDRKYEEFKKYCEGLEKNCEETDKEIGLIEVNENIRTFMDEACMYCSASDIDIEVLFSYTISNYCLIKSKFKEIEDFLEKTIFKIPVPKELGEAPEYKPEENRQRGGSFRGRGR